VRLLSRPFLSGAALGLLVTSFITAVALSGQSEDPTTVGLPQFPVVEQQQAAAALPAPIVTGPPITGKQIASSAIAPARDRANTLIEQARAAAEADDDDDDDDRGSSIGQLRQKIREACKEGRIRGAICTGA
jgi:hypothetical protein